MKSLDDEGEALEQRFEDGDEERLADSFAGRYPFVLGGDKIGAKVTDISDFFGNKKSADNLADYSNQVTAACLNGNIQACGTMDNLERQRRQCIGETLSSGTRLSNVPFGGPLQSQVGKSGLSVGKNR